MMSRKFSQRGQYLISERVFVYISFKQHIPSQISSLNTLLNTRAIRKQTQMFAKYAQIEE